MLALVVTLQYLGKHSISFVDICSYLMHKNSGDGSLPAVLENADCWQLALFGLSDDINLQVFGALQLIENIS